jgi:tRNA wybutosine-synthesizing protein 1
MVSKKLKEVLKKQHYSVFGDHSAVQICRWCKKDLLDEGECYKAQFYGIKSGECCQMSCCILCENRCLHCWRAIELGTGTKLKRIDNPERIIKECIEAQRKLLTGFKGNNRVNKKKFKGAQEPSQFAISLIGEPTLYPKLGELIKELRKQKKTSFLVTNGLQPAVLSKLNKERNLPTQLYISMNASNKKLYDKWHRSKVKNAWKKFNESLEVMNKLKKKTRTVIRMTLVKDLNMREEHVEEYVKLIKKANPDWIEVKGFMSVGFARKRLGYEMMPRHDLVRDYAERIAIELGEGCKILDENVYSAVVLIGKSKSRMKIQKNEI